MSLEDILSKFKNAGLNLFVKMSPGKLFKIAGIGEILWDMYPNNKKLGGAPANFAYHVSLSLATILKLNDFELDKIKELLSIRNEYREIEVCKFLINKYKLNLVCLTKGEKGSVLVDKHSAYICPAFPYKVINRVGAGDAFTAVVIINYLKNNSLKVISERANRLASWVTSKKESMPIYNSKIKSIIDS